MKKTIQKPLNWQDFEDLCKVLWGELWNISNEIKKNGRSGQPQCGVDIYGIPEGKDNYYGIQCKGKDDYTDSTLTITEIDIEVKKAQNFKPALEYFIFATSCNKDARIEEYIREIDLNSRKNKKFKILLFCWEDIADLIERNKIVYDYYVRDKKHITNYSVALLFNSEKNDILEPKFERELLKYVIGRHKSLGAIEARSVYSLGTHDVNHSWVEIKLKLENNGGEVLEDYKLYVTPNKTKTRKIRDIYPPLAKITQKHSPPFIVWEDDKETGYFPHENKPLVQKDSRTFSFLILLDPYIEEIELEYEFFARNYNSTGTLIAKIKPCYIDKTSHIFVDTQEERMPDHTIINDYITKEAGMGFIF